MDFHFTQKDKAQQKFSDYIDLLFQETANIIASDKEISKDELNKLRIKRSEDLTEAYFEFMGQHVPPNLLERLATYLLYDYVKNRSRSKINEENAFHTERQERRFLENTMLLSEIEFNESIKTGNKKVQVFEYDDFPMNNRTGNKLQRNEVLDTTNHEHIDFEMQETLEEIVETSKLSPKEKQIITLLALEEKEPAEIARDLGITRQTVHIHINSAREKIRKHRHLF